MVASITASCGIFVSPKKAVWAHAEGQCERDLRGCQRACDQAVAANSDRTTCKVLSIMWAEQDPAYLQARPSHRLDRMLPKDIIDLRNFADEVCRDGIQRACRARDALDDAVAGAKDELARRATDEAAEEQLDDDELQNATGLFDKARKVMAVTYGCWSPSASSCKNRIPEEVRTKFSTVEGALEWRNPAAVELAQDLLATVEADRDPEAEKLAEAKAEEQRADRAAAAEKAAWNAARELCLKSATECETMCDENPRSKHCVAFAALLFNGHLVTKDRKRAFSLVQEACDAGLAPGCAVVEHFKKEERAEYLKNNLPALFAKCSQYRIKIQQLKAAGDIEGLKKLEPEWSQNIDDINEAIELKTNNEGAEYRQLMVKFKQCSGGL